MVKEENLLKYLLLTGGRNNNRDKKKTLNKTTKTPFFNKGLRRFFFDPQKGFFIITMSKNGKTARKQYLPGLFVYKNIGSRIIPWKSNR